MQTLVIDVEVASLETLEVIQLAYARPGDGRCWSRNYRPAGAYSLGALATHHILPETLQHCDPSSAAMGDLPKTEYVVAHNVDFDADCLGGLPGVKRICTLAMARATWPELDCHKLGAMAYHVCGINSSTRSMLQGAHDASVDVMICILILDAVVEANRLKVAGGYDWASIYAFSEEARIPKVMTFGKHRGEKIADVPASYVSWLMKQDDVCPYLRKAFAR